MKDLELFEKELLTLSSKDAGCFLELVVFLKEAAHRVDEKHSKLYAEIILNLDCIVDDLRNLLLTVLRFQTVRNSNIEQNLAERFCALDVHLFVSNMRSIFDHLVAGLVPVAELPGSKNRQWRRVRQYYGELQKWLAHSDSQNFRTDPWCQKFAELLVECDWFSELNDLRNGLVHFGSEARVLFPLRGNAIFFQVFDTNGAARVSRDKWPDKVFGSGDYIRFLDFKFFAAVTFARMVKFLDSFGFFYMELIRRATNVSGFMLGKVILPESTCLKEWAKHSMAYLTPV